LNKNDLLHKPNRTIMMTNKNISALQRKSYNVILHQARTELKNNNQRTVFYFSFKDLKEKSGLNSTENVKLKNSLEKLAGIQVKTVHENGDWGVFNLISYAGKKDDLLEIELPKPIREALIKNDYYTTLDLMTLKLLEGKYAIILYELAMRYKEIKIPELSIEEFKEITGITETKSYVKFSKIKIKVIEPAIKEINQKTDIQMNYETIKTGRKVSSIKFSIKHNKTVSLEIPKTQIQPEKKEAVFSDQALDLFKLLPKSEQIQKRKQELQDLLEEHTFEYIKSDIEYCNKQQINKGFWAYFLSSMKNGHYSADEIEKAKKLEEKKQAEELKNQEIEKNKKLFEEELQKFCLIKLYELEMYEKIELEKEYKKQEKIYKKAKLDFNSFALNIFKNELIDEINERIQEELIEQDNFLEYIEYLEHIKPIVFGDDI